MFSERGHAHKQMNAHAWLSARKRWALSAQARRGVVSPTHTTHTHCLYTDRQCIDIVKCTALHASSLLFLDNLSQLILARGSLLLGLAEDVQDLQLEHEHSAGRDVAAALGVTVSKLGLGVCACRCI